jgi:putative ABC transport system permease protein
MFASDSLLVLWDSLTGAIAATALGVVSVFMLVGGVVIMNIMLAVVTERTHEIGIRKSVGARNGMNYAGTALDHEHLIEAQDETRTLIRTYRHLGPKDEDSFSMLTSDALLDFWNQLTGAIAATAVAVVSVFMVVGGVVIMNIMLAVVTERTHEIGIRKSVGARRRDILNQFLVESSMLSGIGGLMGVTLAWIVAVVVRNFTAVPMSVPATAVIVGVALSTAVGLFFGIYPAQRAAKLDPIEALRAEK